VLLDQLAPVERAVFVLADVFEVPYAEIATTVGRSQAACRQIASRARRRLRPDKQPDKTAAADRELVNGLLRALASGDVNQVIAHLAPQVVCITDGGPNRRAAHRPVAGSDRVARFLITVARRYRHLATRPTVVGGSAGAILSAGDTIQQVMAVTSKDGVIISVYFIGNPDKLTSVGHPALIQ
jgi:RNA polymerase sigma-70 factor (ECF subfamily)